MEWVIKISNITTGHYDSYYYSKYDPKCERGWSYYLSISIKGAVRFPTREECVTHAVMLRMLCHKKDSTFYIEEVDKLDKVELVDDYKEV